MARVGKCPAPLFICETKTNIRTCVQSFISSWTMVVLICKPIERPQLNKENYHNATLKEFLLTRFMHPPPTNKLCTFSYTHGIFSYNIIFRCEVRKIYRIEKLSIVSENFSSKTSLYSNNTSEQKQVFFNLTSSF